MRWIVIAAALLGLGTDLQAETVHLKRGGTLEGNVVERDETIDVHVEGGRTTFSKSEVGKVESGSSRHSFLRKVESGVHEWRSGLVRAFQKVRQVFSAVLNKIRETAAAWTRPVSRSEAVVAKEKAANDAMLQVQQVLKDVHARDKKVSQTRRAMKLEGVEW